MKNNFQLGVECLVNANKKFWGDEVKPINNEGWIFVLHSLHHDFLISVQEDIIAKGVQDKTGFPIASIISGRADELMDLMGQVDESFGIKYSTHSSYYDYNCAEIENIARKMAVETYGNKADLVKLAYRDIKFGDVIYDDILRRGNSKKRGDVFDCFDVSQERYYTFIRNALAIIDQAYELFREKKPCFLVTTEYLYTKSLYAHVANALGAKILVGQTTCLDAIVQIDPDRQQLSDVKFADILRAQKEVCIQRYPLDALHTDNYFLSAKSEEGETVKLPKEWLRKKNVIILPHAFSDAPREVCRHHIYYDYREWLLDTLRIIKDITAVNWIIKDHPWAGYYGQENYIKSIFEDNKTENMYWLDKDYSGVNVKDFADCILTCAGTAGIEYWAYGIPTITTGEAFYCSWGISYQMKTLDEYEYTLKNIETLAKPSNQSIELAAKYLIADKNQSNQCDALSKLLYDYRMKEVNTQKRTASHYGVNEDTDQQLGEIVREFCEVYAMFLQKNDIRQGNIFQLNNLAEL